MEPHCPTICNIGDWVGDWSWKGVGCSGHREPYHEPNCPPILVRQMLGKAMQMQDLRSELDTGLDMLAGLLPPSIAFWLLGAYNTSTFVFDSCVSIVTRVYHAALYACYPPTYYFFHDRVMPCEDRRAYNIGANGSATPMWTYNPEQFQFVAWPPVATDDLTMSHQLPILSMEIIHNDTVLYDITDFIEKVRVYNPELDRQSPSAAHVVGAWTLTSGVIPDLYMDLELRIIDLEANTKTIPIMSMDPLEDVAEEVAQKVDEIVRDIEEAEVQSQKED